MSHVVLHAFYLYSKTTWSCPMWFYMHFTSIQRPRGHVPCGSTCILPLFKDHVVTSHVVLHAFYLFSKTTWSRPMWFYMHFTSFQRPRGHVPCGSTCILPLFKDHVVTSHVVLHAFYLFSKTTWSCPMWFYMHFTSFQRPRGHVPCGSTCILPLFKDHVVMSHVVLHAFYLYSKTTWSCPMWFYMHFTSFQRQHDLSHVVLHAFYLFSKITWSCPMWFYMHFTSIQRPRGHVPCGSTCILPLFKDNMICPMWFYMHFTSFQRSRGHVPCGSTCILPLFKDHVVMSHVVLHAFYLFSKTT